MSTDTGQSQAHTRIDEWYARTIGYERVYVAVRDLSTVTVRNNLRSDDDPTLETGAPFELTPEEPIPEVEVDNWAIERVREYFYLSDTPVSALLERTNGTHGGVDS